MSSRSSVMHLATDTQNDASSSSGSESDSEALTGSDSSSGSGSDSSSDSSSSLHHSRPIFLKKKSAKGPNSTYDAAAAVLSKAEHLQQIEAKTLEKEPFDGVDDRDDIDPEYEYSQWKLREAFRKKRDTKLVAEAELAKEDAVRRKKGLANGGSKASPEEAHQESEANEARKSAKLGAFYAENLDEKFLKRDYKDVEGKEDHSRPTKYIKH